MQTKISKQKITIKNKLLINAIKINNLNLIKDLIEEVDINDIYDNEGQTPLLIALSYGDFLLEIVKVLINKGASLHPKNEEKRTALHVAAMTCTEVTLNILFKKGAKINETTVNGATPLMIAAEIGNYPAVSFFIKNGANVNVRNRERLTALNYAQESLDQFKIIHQTLVKITQEIEEKNLAKMNEYEKIVAALQHNRSNSSKPTQSKSVLDPLEQKQSILSIVTPKILGWKKTKNNDKDVFKCVINDEFLKNMNADNNVDVTIDQLTDIIKDVLKEKLSNYNLEIILIDNDQNEREIIVNFDCFSTEGLKQDKSFYKKLAEYQVVTQPFQENQSTQPKPNSNPSFLNTWKGISPKKEVRAHARLLEENLARKKALKGARKKSKGTEIGSSHTKDFKSESHEQEFEVFETSTNTNASHATNLSSDTLRSTTPIFFHNTKKNHFVSIKQFQHNLTQCYKKIKVTCMLIESINDLNQLFDNSKWDNCIKECWRDIISLHIYYNLLNEQDKKIITSCNSTSQILETIFSSSKITDGTQQILWLMQISSVIDLIDPLPQMTKNVV